MDVMMPNVDGLTTARIIRALDRPDVETVPILALTANAFAEDVQLAKNTGMNEHIAKPLELDKLNDVLKQWLQ
jgi:two-component system sensor histidine kinase/response regulator